MAVLLAAAILVDSKPPPQRPSPTLAHSTEAPSVKRKPGRRTEMNDSKPGSAGAVVRVRNGDRRTRMRCGSRRYRGVDIDALVGNVSFEQVRGLPVDQALEPGRPPSNVEFGQFAPSPPVGPAGPGSPSPANELALDPAHRHRRRGGEGGHGRRLLGQRRRSSRSPPRKISCVFLSRRSWKEDGAERFCAHVARAHRREACVWILMYRTACQNTGRKRIDVHRADHCLHRGRLRSCAPRCGRRRPPGRCTARGARARAADARRGCRVRRCGESGRAMSLPAMSGSWGSARLSRADRVWYPWFDAPAPDGARARLSPRRGRRSAREGGARGDREEEP